MLKLYFMLSHITVSPAWQVASARFPPPAAEGLRSTLIFSARGGKDQFRLLSLPSTFCQAVKHKPHGGRGKRLIVAFSSFTAFREGLEGDRALATAPALKQEEVEGLPGNSSAVNFLLDFLFIYLFFERGQEVHPCSTHTHTYTDLNLKLELM